VNQVVENCPDLHQEEFAPQLARLMLRGEKHGLFFGEGTA
jgi:hypothetical protein